VDAQGLQSIEGAPRAGVWVLRYDWMVQETPEVVLALPERFDRVRHIRSTVLLSSYAAIRDRGYDTPYRAALPKEHHPALFEAVAGMWIPIEAAVAHYEACAALGLSHDAQIALGRELGQKIRGTILGTAVRLTKEAGVTPWTVMPQFQRIWNRAYDGGGLYIEKRGPKEAHMEVHKASPADCVYWRTALCGLSVGIIELFAGKAYMQETTRKRRPGFASFRLQWA